MVRFGTRRRKPSSAMRSRRSLSQTRYLASLAGDGEVEIGLVVRVAGVTECSRYLL
jgi:hypothetical protein